MATLKLRLGKPSEFATELKEAEEAYAGTDNSGDRVVSLKVGEVRVRPTLFQPREFSFGAREVDRDHVTRLVREIRIKGELDPILVIRLEDEWVCVDGHHRLAAYEHLKRSEPLKCERFVGASVREAIDEGLRRNSKRQLTLENTDRQEAAWRHVVCDWGSKKEIAAQCGVSVSQVGFMRRVKGAWRRRDDIGAHMKREIPEGPGGGAPWWKARAVYLQLDQEMASEAVQAQRLARSLQSKMSNTLRADLKISAMALEAYSPDLVRFIRENHDIKGEVTDEAEEGVRAKVELDLMRERIGRNPRGEDERLLFEREILLERLQYVDEQINLREARTQGGRESD